MIPPEDLSRGIRATEQRLAEARKDPLVIRELEEARAEQTAQERERNFRILAGCWADDSGDDDVEAILRRGRASRAGNRAVPDFGGWGTATARHYGLVAVTDNLRHFSRMPGVSVENWVSRPPSRPAWRPADRAWEALGALALVLRRKLRK